MRLSKKSFFRLSGLLSFLALAAPVALPSALAQQPGRQQGQGISMTVMPMIVEVNAPKVAETITVRNSSRQPMKMQFRVYRWQKKNGKDMFAPTSDVVITPPFITIRPGADGVARLVRVSKKPLTGEESYRVFIDQMPSSRVRVDVNGVRSGVAMTLGQSIPAFFYPASTSSAAAAVQAQPVFSVAAKGKNYEISVINPLNQRLRMSDVELLAGGRVIARKRGLLGYALPGEQASFNLSGKGGGMPDRIRYSSDAGRVEAPL